jgi:hypothetical protein
MFTDFVGKGKLFVKKVTHETLGNCMKTHNYFIVKLWILSPLNSRCYKYNSCTSNKYLDIEAK